jgi:tetrahydromethanopterin S-methyltransferase subunit F
MPAAAAQATGPAISGDWVEQALDGLHNHHRTGREDQQAVHQRHHLGAAAESVGEAPPSRPAAEPICPPTQGKADHIAEVVEGIADQRQRTEPETDRQLQGRQAAVENDAPAEGTAGLTVGVVVVAVMVMVVFWFVPVLASHGSGLLLGSQVEGDHLLHALLGAAVRAVALGGPGPIELHAQLLGNPAGEQHLALTTGGAALGGHRRSGINGLNVYL